MPRQGQKESELKANPEGEMQIVGLFDIDGTLTQGFAILSFARHLNLKGLFAPIAWDKMLEDFSKYKESSKGHGDYEKFALDLVDHYAEGLKGQEVFKIEHEGEIFADEVRSDYIEDYILMGFASQVVDLINKFGKSIAISGSPHEALWPLVKSLGFFELKATTMETEDGVYTGLPKINLALDKNKQQIVDDILDRGVDAHKSFAFGDSLHDLPILEAVENRYALGDNQGLHKLFQERGWPVYENGKGIVEALTKRTEELFK